MIPHFPQYTKYTHVMIRFKLKLMPVTSTSRCMSVCLSGETNEDPASDDDSADESPTRPPQLLHCITQIYVLILL